MRPAHTKSRFQSQALEAGTQVISVLLFWDSITLGLSITCKINCVSHAVDIDHLRTEVVLTQSHRRYSVWWHTPATCPLELPTSLNVSVVGSQ